MNKTLSSRYRLIIALTTMRNNHYVIRANTTTEPYHHNQLQYLCSLRHCPVTGITGSIDQTSEKTTSLSNTLACVVVKENKWLISEEDWCSITWLTFYKV